MKDTRFLIAVAAAGLLCAQARVDPNLVGSWEAQAAGSPLKMALRIEASGRCSVDQDAGTCLTLGGMILYKSSDGEMNRYAYRLQGGQLTISGGDLTAPLVFRRAGAGSGGLAPAAPSPGPPVQPATPMNRGRAPGFQHEAWGLGFDVPPSWRVAERDGLLLMGSDTEAGMILVRMMQGTNRAALLGNYREGFEEEGLRLRPTAEAQEFAAGQNRGLAGEMAGVGANGMSLRARVIGVLSPFGDAAVFLGLTTADKYPQLRPRVDAAAASASFTKPRTPPANLSIAGQYYFFYSSSIGGYSRDDTLNLCANGMFNRGGEMSASQAGQWGMASQRSNAGRWSAQGDGSQGVVTLNYSNGRTAQLRYQRAGADMVFDGQKYARFGDGSCSKRSAF